MNELDVLLRNTRRQFFLQTAALALAACETKKPTPASPSAPATTQAMPASAASNPKPAFFADWKELSFEATQDFEAEEAAVMLPKTQERLPLLVALHGYGESRHGLAFGARGWRDQYDLDLIHSRLSAPPLTPKDARDLITPERLTELNESLQARPYRGLVVACPYTPSLKDKSPGGAEGFGKFVTGQLLPRVQRESNCLTERAQTGINGVSMGGRLSLLVGLSRPDIFGVIGSLQTAMKRDEAPLFGRLIKGVMKKSPVVLRLVSSEEDPFLPAMASLHEWLDKEKIEHSFFVTPGPHDYIWNQGPGSLEMLFWHERTQAPATK